MQGTNFTTFQVNGLLCVERFGLRLWWKKSCQLLWGGKKLEVNRKSEDISHRQA